MSFRDEVNNTTKSVMIETFITSIFKNPHRRFGDILEDLLELDDPDDDWMRDTLYDLEVGQFVRAGMKVMGLAQGEVDEKWVGGDTADEEPEEEEEDEPDEEADVDEDDEEEEDPEEEEEEDEGDEEDEDGDPISGPLRNKDDEDHEAEGEEEEEEEEPDPEPKAKKKKKKKKAPPNGKAKKKKKVKSVPAKRQKDPEEESENEDYLKLILKALRAGKAYDEETAVNNRFVLDHIHGEDNHDDDEGAAFRAGIKELESREKICKVGQRRGTRYHLV